MINALPTLMAGEIKLNGKTDAAPMTPPLSVGEVLEATVTGRQGGKFTILVKGFPMEASSDVPLAEGQKLAVRINQLYPKILMGPVKCAGMTEDSGPILERIRLFRQNPDLFLHTFQVGKEMFSSSNIEKFQALLPETDFPAMKDRFESLVFSGDALEDHAGKLGLLHEHAILSGRGSGDNLKAMLMNLQAAIERTIGEKGAAGSALAGLSEFAASTVAGIETCQAVNLLSMDQEGLFFLPLPFLVRDDIRTGEFYAAKKKTARGEELRAVLFLDMDNLGKVMAEARLAGGSIKCAIRCEDPAARDFLASRTALLKDGLDALGYKTGDIRCYHERNLDAARKDILEEFPAYREGVLHVTV